MHHGVYYIPTKLDAQDKTFFKSIELPQKILHLHNLHAALEYMTRKLFHTR